MSVDKKKLKQLSESIIVETQPIMMDVDVINESRDEYVFIAIQRILKQAIKEINKKHVDNVRSLKDIESHLEDAIDVAEQAINDSNK